MNENIILENYNELLSKHNGAIPSIERLKEHILYNIEAKCYDIIFGLTKGNVNEQEIVDFLEKKKLVFIWEGKIYNRSQTMLFDF